MIPTDLHHLRERIDRSRRAVEAKAHVGYTDAHTFSDGNIHTVRVSGIKAPALLEDEILTLFVWIWSMKDHLKELCRIRGIDPAAIEKIVNSKPSLMFTADIANRAKHGTLRESRSGKFARLEDVGFTVPQTALKHISVEAFAVGADVAFPEQAELHASIEFNTQESPADAFAVIELAIEAGESRAFHLAGVSQVAPAE